jgi:hypothetical protein
MPLDLPGDRCEAQSMIGKVRDDEEEQHQAGQQPYLAKS